MSSLGIACWGHLAGICSCGAGECGCLSFDHSRVSWAGGCRVTSVTRVKVACQEALDLSQVRAVAEENVYWRSTRCMPMSLRKWAVLESLVQQ